MGLLGKIFVRGFFSVLTVVLIVFEVLKVATAADMVNSTLFVAAIMSADMLIEQYISRDDDEID